MNFSQRGTFVIRRSRGVGMITVHGRAFLRSPGRPLYLVVQYFWDCMARSSQGTARGRRRGAGGRACGNRRRGGRRRSGTCRYAGERRVRHTRSDHWNVRVPTPKEAWNIDHRQHVESGTYPRVTAADIPRIDYLNMRRDSYLHRF